jgi:YHS domain-containing protein
VDLPAGLTIVTVVAKRADLKLLCQVVRETVYQQCTPISGSSNVEERKKAIDPVCGMEVDEKTAAATSEYQGKTYYFCAPGCKAAFDKDPEKYLNGEAAGSYNHHH